MTRVELEARRALYSVVKKLFEELQNCKLFRNSRPNPCEFQKTGSQYIKLHYLHGHLDGFSVNLDD